MSTGRTTWAAVVVGVAAAAVIGFRVTRPTPAVAPASSSDVAAASAGASSAATPASLAAAPAAAAPAAAPVPNGQHITVYKSPTCGCCNAWVEHLERAGFQVNIRDTPDVGVVNASFGIPDKVSSCHTAFVGGYAVVGHVPADLIEKLLKERPKVAGIAVPGMPVGSPGMEQGGQKEPYDVVLFTADGKTTVYAHR